ncbi:polysaccharide pyruvyl transferase family protein [Neobacillus cucumis]|uniref:Polysaccharide biosynthesis protein n=1 Tax=Neobacillus cucumis TaxID=1740721 RepID=A0A2N5H6G0_9BACI|nr:polysaccharide pyruvyl transferase family protein [Neobacillus cucumis]PLS01102.1 polysaccharide biosynthesis protein [Neobacillus cucumis]
MLEKIESLKSSVVTKIVPIGWRLKIKSLRSGINHDSLISKNEPKIIVAIAADYGNLGDIAITHAQINFLRDHFPRHKIIPIHVDDFFMIIKLKKLINDVDIITIIGGGNMGDLYEGLESYRRYIIHLFPNNKIISFPQSIHFQEKKSLDKSIKIYSKHQNLHIFAREMQSYEIMKDCFRKNNVYLVPDIVLSLNRIEPILKRDGIIICLRNDLEKKISRNLTDSLVSSIKDRYKKVSEHDTVINNYSVEFAMKELDRFLENFKSAKVVVTDRLHGMIFCAITNTPCLVLPNSNHKIASTYHQWLVNFKHIILVEKFDEETMLGLIDTLYDSQTSETMFNSDFNDKFTPLLKALKDEVYYSRKRLKLLKASIKLFGWIFHNHSLRHIALLVYLLNMDLDFFIFMITGVF